MLNSVGEQDVEGIGGPAAFVITVSDLAEFANAIRRKLEFEIAGQRR
jgi:Protein of unknown function (DUF1194)